MDLTCQKQSALLPNTITEEVYSFTEKAQFCNKKSKERQKRKFQTIQQRAYASQNTSASISQAHDDTTDMDIQDHWVKNLSDSDLTQPEKAKGLNFAISQQLPVVDLITATESAIRNDKISEAEAEQLCVRVTAALSSTKTPPSNLTPQERKGRLSSLSRDQNIANLPADKGRCTVVLNTADYHRKITTLLSDNSTYEALKRDPTNMYKKRVTDYL